MSDTGIVDTFLDTFTTYIDSGFGLLGGEVGFLSSTLIAIDVTIAGLFWAWGADEDVIQRLVKKTLYIGAFAFIIGNFQSLATILFESFAGLGLKASGDSLSLAQFMKPGTIAGKGLDAAQPLIDAMEVYNSLWAVFANIAIIALLLLAYLIVVLAFFIIAIQVFITLIEFKLVTLAGFVLLPFAFWNRTAFMAEKVLGHIVSSGIKVLVLAVITGIGTTLFDEFTVSVGPDPTAREVLAIALGALSLLGLAIFGPGIANGIVSGGPQLGAAAAKMGVGAAGSALGATGRMAGAAAQGGARMAGGAAGAYSVGSLGRSGVGAVAGGMAAVGQKTASGAVHAALSPLRRMAGKASASMKGNFRTGARAGLGAAPAASGGTAAASSAAPASAQPAWAAAMKNRQSATHGATVLAHTMKAGDSHGGGAGPDIKERE